MSILAKRVKKTQRSDEPTEVVVTIKGRTILFEAERVTRMLHPNKTVYRTTMVIDERVENQPSAVGFREYQAAMSVALLRELPGEE